MDFLNKAMEQVRDLFRTMTPGARMVAALLVVVLVVSLVWLFNLQATSGDVYLLGGRDFSQAELGAMEAALAEARFTKYSIEGYKLKVPRSRHDEALAAIVRAEAMPKLASEFDDPSRGFNPLLTRSQEEKQAKVEKQAKFAAMMRQVRTLERVALEYDEIREGGLGRKVRRTAYVTAKAQGQRALESHEIQAIVHAVEGVLAGIVPQDIRVVDENTGKSHRGRASDDLNDPSNNVYAQTKRYYEDDWRDKIAAALASFGAPNVQVNVELDETVSHVEEARQLNSPVVISTETEKESNETTGRDVGGRPGVAANTGAANSTAVVSTSGGTTNSTQSRESSESRVGGTISATTKAALVPKRVSVSVGIPESYYRAIWAKRNPPAAGEEPKVMTSADLLALQTEVEGEVEKKVQPLIKTELNGQDIFEPIVVTTDYEIPSSPVAEPSTAATAFDWLATNWQTLGLFGLGAFGLMMLRSMVRGATPKPTPIDDQDGAAMADERDEEDETAEDRQRRRFEIDGDNLKEELIELIQDDPDAAVNVLKQWIGEAA